MFVRDAVTADVVLPRFLAPDDTGRVALSLHNVEGQAGDYKVTLEATGSVALERPVSETRHLDANQRELLTWPLEGRRRRLRQGRGRGQRPGQLLGPPRMGHPGARGADADARSTPSPPLEAVARADGRPQGDLAASPPAPRR